MSQSWRIMSVSSPSSRGLRYHPQEGKRGAQKGAGGSGARGQQKDDRGANRGGESGPEVRWIDSCHQGDILRLEGEEKKEEVGGA